MGRLIREASSPESITSAVFFFGSIITLRDLWHLIGHADGSFYTGPVLVWATIVAAGLCFVAGVLRSQTALRIAAAVAFCATQYFLHIDPYKADHTTLLSVYTLLVLAFIPNSKLSVGLEAARILLLSTYTISGVMKIFAIAYQCLHHSSACSAYGASALFASSELGSGRRGLVQSFFVEHNIVALEAYILVIAFQIAIPLLYFLGKGRALVGIELITFHIVVYLVMQILFLENIILIFLLFVLPVLCKRISQIIDMQTRIAPT